MTSYHNTPQNTDRSRTGVLLAAAVVVALVGILVIRLLAPFGGGTATASEIEPAHVPPPATLDVASLEIPCWSCPAARSWDVNFMTDLDLLAPLGEGEHNAGDWFKDFAKPDGARFADAEAMMERRVVDTEDQGNVLALDDPILVEAQPWVDQATMSFYPDIFPLEGFATRIPNLLFMLVLGRSWVHHGVESPDPEAGLELCRRTIRLGRLLRQEDVTVIADLVGLACIHIATRGVYDIAVREGDLELALLASIVVGEVAGQRHMTSERITRFDFSPYVRIGDDGVFTLDLPAGTLARTLDGIDSWTQRRFFGEAVLVANLVYHLGQGEDRETAVEFIDGLLASDDEFLVEFARWAVAHPPTEELMEDVMNVK